MSNRNKSSSAGLEANLRHRTKRESSLLFIKPRDAQVVCKQRSATATAEHLNEGSSLYLNRELSWIEFNKRVLNEARRSTTPLLERLKFLAIVSSNTDEFYMKRMGGLLLQIGSGVTRLTIDGRTPAEQFELCRSELLSMQNEKESLCRNALASLSVHGVKLCRYADLKPHEQLKLTDHFTSEILPLITPLVIDRSHPFPFISNLSLNLLVTMTRQHDSQLVHARVKIPTGSSRFLKVGASNRFVALEDLIIQNLSMLFPQANIVSSDVFRITRNAITEHDYSGAEDMVEFIESALHNRKFAPVVRLQVEAQMDPKRRHFLADQLGLNNEKDVFESAILVRMSDLMQIATLALPDLRDKPHYPKNNAKLDKYESVFRSIRDNTTILLQHPYESFSSSVEHFVRQASADSQVAAIKMTLYRTSEDTKILQYLIDATNRGIQVAVVVELKARFDEAANIKWASLLEQAGVHVSYGIANLKTHCKTILVVRREGIRFRQYAHIGTGNYNVGTSRLYSDFGLLTCDTALTQDIAQLFNFLTTGCHPERLYQEILVAPMMIKAALIAKIEREIKHCSSSLPGLIRLKTNALEDPDITEALYRASQSGVTVELVVRDICRLRPGLKTISENIHVVSVVGRFLEHARIYHFHNAGNEEYYIGSADLMTRNLERRVELLVPVKDSDARTKLAKVLHEQLNDGVNSWRMHSDGSYRKFGTDSFKAIDSHTAVPATYTTHETSIDDDEVQSYLATKEHDHG
ncbi:MAG: polyphosphate kinase 1 [Granulosicoccus sp.]